MKILKNTLANSFASQLLFGTIASSIAAIALIGCSGTSSDPKTLVKGDLNPPFNLSSITYQDGFILQWDISNTEKGVTGYNVYVAKTSLAELQSTLKGKVAGKKIDRQQIRRCVDTKDLFAKFGFKATDKYAAKDCDDFAEEDSSSASTPTSATLNVDGRYFADETTPATSATEGSATNIMNCKSITNTDMSKPGLFSVDITKAIDVEGNAISTNLKDRVGKSIRCILGKNDTLSDGSKGFAFGETYSAFVVAVEGDKAGKVSYTSNFVEDIPATQFTASIPLDDGKAKVLKIKDSGSGNLDGLVSNDSTITSLSANSIDCTDECKIGRNFAVPPSSGFASMAFIEDIQSNSDRIFYAGEQGKVYITPVNPRPSKINGKQAIYMPGDIAPMFEADQTYFSGKNFEMYPGSMFYFAIKRSSSEVFYGKTYVESIVANGANKTMALLMTLQTKANSQYSSLTKALPWMFENN